MTSKWSVAFSADEWLRPSVFKSITLLVSNPAPASGLGKRQMTIRLGAGTVSITAMLTATFMSLVAAVSHVPTIEREQEMKQKLDTLKCSALEKAFWHTRHTKVFIPRFYRRLAEKRATVVV